MNPGLLPLATWSSGRWHAASRGTAKSEFMQEKCWSEAPSCHNYEGRSGLCSSFSRDRMVLWLRSRDGGARFLAVERLLSVTIMRKSCSARNTGWLTQQSAENEQFSISSAYPAFLLGQETGMKLSGRQNSECFDRHTHNGCVIDASQGSLRRQRVTANPYAAWPQPDSSYRSKEQRGSRRSLLWTQRQHVLPWKRSKPRVASSKAATMAGST